MSIARKLLVTVLLIIALLVLAIFVTTPQGWARERGRITSWNVRVVKVEHHRTRGVRCDHRSRAVEKTMGGNRMFGEIISFYSDVTWRWGSGVVCGKPQVDVWPDHARAFWEWQGITATTGPRSWYPCPCPPVEHVMTGRWVKYTRGFEWLQQVVTPYIKWEVMGSGGCIIHEAGHDDYQLC